MTFRFYSFYFWFFLSAMGLLSLVNIRAVGRWVHRHLADIFCMTAAIGLFLVLSSDLWGTSRYQPRHDNWKYAFPFFDFFLDSLARTGELPYWNPYVNGGMPAFLWINHVFLFHLPHLMAYAVYPLAWHQVTTLQMYWFTLVVGNLIFSLGCYGVFRMLFFNRVAAIYGFVLCLFSGVTVGTLHQEQLMASIFYIPWVALFGILYFRSGRLPWGILSALFFGLSLLNHYPHLVFYFWGTVSLACAVFFSGNISEFFRKNGPRVRRFVFLAGIFIPIFFLPIAVLYGHYKPLLVSPARDAQTMEVTASYDQIMNSLETNSFNIHTLLHYIYPQTFFSIPQDHQLFGQNRLDNFIFYLGLLPLFFALYEALKGKGAYRRPVLLSLGILFLLAMGGNSFGYFLLYKLIPFSNLQRLPVHVANYCNLLLILLSVGGVRTYLEKEKIPLASVGLPQAGGRFFALAGLGPFGRYAVLKPVLRSALDETLLFGAMLWFFFWMQTKRTSKMMIGILFFLLVFDLGRYTHFVLANEKALLETRFDFHSNRENRLPEFREFFESEPGRTPYQAMLQKKPVWTASNRTLMELKEGREFIAQNESFLKDRANHGELYRSYFLVPDGEVRVESFSPTRVVFDVSATEPSRLIYRQNKDAGWSATQNGAPVAIADARPFQAVEVSRGKTRVILTYDPFWKWPLHLVLQVFFLGVGGSLIYLYSDALARARRPIP
ncbi:MAG: hypothetical protein HYZ52_01200 [Candidatus Omnitrophica bacterium]|nr:hypothetical protein [Candidatus Omnitrophota bacterium]